MTPVMASLIAGVLCGYVLTTGYYFVKTEAGFLAVTVAMLLGMAPAPFFGHAGGQLYMGMWMMITLVVFWISATILSYFLPRD